MSFETEFWGITMGYPSFPTPTVTNREVWTASAARAQHAQHVAHLAVVHAKAVGAFGAISLGANLGRVKSGGRALAVAEGTWAER